jgi:DNA-binding NarL/FixJ family response regulator
LLPRGKRPNLYLSPAELAVAEFYAKTSLQQQEIADKLFVCVKTIKLHGGNIFKKLGLKSRIELVQSYYQRGIAYEAIENGSPLPWPPEGLE